MGKPTQATDYDVVIVGARCGGAAAARLLSEQGLRVLALDRAAFPSDTVSTHALAGHGSALLQRWGLLDRLLATDLPTSRVVAVKAAAVEIAAAPLHERHPGYMAPRRTVLDTMLVDAARESGAEVWEDTVVEHLSLDDHGVVDGVALRRGAERHAVTADLVIGADGRRSTVARQVGAEAYDVRPSNLSGVYAYYAATELDTSILALQDQRLALAFLTNDGLACLSAAGPDDEFRGLLAGGDDEFAVRAESVCPWVADAVRRGRRETRFVGFRGQPGHLRVPHGPGWALVGDAGYYKDPITGQGMADAFLSAQLVSDAVAECLAVTGSVKPSPTLTEAMASTYHRRRDEIHGEMYAHTQVMARLDAGPGQEIEQFLRYRQLADETMFATMDRYPAVVDTLAQTA